MKNTQRENAFSLLVHSVILLPVCLISYHPLSLIPLTLRRPVVIILVVTFLHNFAFNAGTFYLALFFQVRYFFSSLPLGPSHKIIRSLTVSHLCKLASGCFLTL